MQNNEVNERQRTGGWVASLHVHSLHNTDEMASYQPSKS